MWKFLRFTAVCLAMVLALGGCMRAEDAAEKSAVATGEVAVPEEVDQQDGLPMLRVYLTDEEKVERMDIETYLMGVVAGEMKNDWPLEALKAQAILARTFTLKFLETKKSGYEGADISTDVTEAQAYNAQMINENVRRAVEETRGVVMAYGDTLPQAWFHAHSGGKTEAPTVALEYKEDPEYLKSVASQESDKAPKSAAHWTAEFTAAEVGRACAACGVETGDCREIEIGEKGESGRAKNLIINGKSVSAPSFRIQIGPEKLRSTLIEEVRVENGKVIFTGRGFGHGVGLSQWGAYQLAESGATAQSIISKYYQGIKFVGLWE